MWPPLPPIPWGAGSPFFLYPASSPSPNNLFSQTSTCSKPSPSHLTIQSMSTLQRCFLKTHFENLKILHRIANQGPHGLSAFGLRAGSDLRTPHSLLLPRWQIYISFVFVFSATCGRSLRSWRQSNLRTSRLVTVFDLIIRSGTQQYNWDCRE